MLTGRQIWELARLSATTIFREGWSPFLAKAAGVIRTLRIARRFQMTRGDIAEMYITGSGIEIGALHYPLKLPPWAEATYVDRWPLAALRAGFPELADKELVDVQIIDNGEALSSIPDSSQDFVIGNHFLEHCEDPVGAIHNMLRVLRNQGIIYVSIPDKRYTFDVDRSITPIEHIVRDYEQGPACSKRSHYEEWSRAVDKVPEEQIDERVRSLVESDANIHYHVWTQTEILEMILALKRTFGFNVEIELIYRNGIEVIIVLRKSA
jgi:SAM-dependent methyltransferase